MGYTNYWYRPQQISSTVYSAMAADMRKLLEARKKLVCYEYDKPRTAPEASDHMVHFNGKGENGHETFYFPRIRTLESWEKLRDGLVFDFTKTARKPYDELVQACLLVAQKHLHAEGLDFRVSSDGGEDEWTNGASEVAAPGYKLVLEVLGADYLNGVTREFTIYNPEDPSNRERKLVDFGLLSGVTAP